MHPDLNSQLEDYCLQLARDLHTKIQGIVQEGLPIPLNAQMCCNGMLAEYDRGKHIELEIAADTYLSEVPSVEGEERCMLTVLFSCVNALMPIYACAIFIAYSASKVFVSVSKAPCYTVVPE